jgi:hypothetical protein
MDRLLETPLLVRYNAEYVVGYKESLLGTTGVTRRLFEIGLKRVP